MAGAKKKQVNIKATTTVPTNLKHKPVYAINGYSAVDGIYKGKTDVVGLSLGKAQ